MDGSRFKDLEAYEQAVGLADDLHRGVLEWGPLDTWSMGIQLIRAADSIGANIAEAYGRHGYADQRRLLYVARGSAYETEHWIDRALTRNLLSAEFQVRVVKLVQTLNGLIRSHHRRS
jgi:four helix bundle protein